MDAKITRLSFAGVYTAAAPAAETLTISPYSGNLIVPWDASIVMMRALCSITTAAGVYRSPQQLDMQASHTALMQRAPSSFFAAGVTDQANVLRILGTGGMECKGVWDPLDNFVTTPEALVINISVRDTMIATDAVQIYWQITLQRIDSVRRPPEFPEPRS